uniref:Uncharacterized protein n=1 Tax=Eutreptiella gymnastica TaxID=73025 RepID=A0A7S4FK95_9EUGL
MKLQRTSIDHRRYSNEDDGYDVHAGRYHSYSDAARRYLDEPGAQEPYDSYHTAPRNYGRDFRDYDDDYTGGSRGHSAAYQEYEYTRGSHGYSDPYLDEPRSYNSYTEYTSYDTEYARGPAAHSRTTTTRLGASRVAPEPRRASPVRSYGTGGYGAEEPYWVRLYEDDKERRAKLEVARKKKLQDEKAELSRMRKATNRSRSVPQARDESARSSDVLHKRTGNSRPHDYSDFSREYHGDYRDVSRGYTASRHYAAPRGVSFEEPPPVPRKSPLTWNTGHDPKEPYWNRLYADDKARREKIDRMRKEEQEQAEKEEQNGDCTFMPRINAPEGQAEPGDWHGRLYTMGMRWHQERSKDREVEQIKKTCTFMPVLSPASQGGPPPDGKVFDRLYMDATRNQTDKPKKKDD